MTIPKNFATVLLLSTSLLSIQAADQETAPGKRPHITSPMAAAVTVPPTSNGIVYHGGPIMLGTTNIYYIWYGNWGTNTAPTILSHFAKYLGGTPYYNINTTYTNSTGQKVANSVAYKTAINDAYSQGTTLTDASVQAVVTKAVTTGGLPKDPFGVYFILASKDVNESSGFCTSYCGFHSSLNLSGVNLKYSFVGNPDRCPTVCAAQQTTSPNNNPGADAMASVIAHELSETVTDPNGNAWFDTMGQETGDKCAWKFGTILKATNGSKYNVTIGGFQMFLQQIWVNASGGSCVMSH